MRSSILRRPSVLHRALIAVLAVLGASRPAFAHDMWIAPEHSALRLGQRLDAMLVVGEALQPQERKPYTAAKTVRFELHDRRGAIDLRARVAEGDDPLLSSLRLRGRGQHLLAIERGWSYLSLPADRFVDYLAHESIPAVLEQPPVGEQHERYRRSLKALVHVGSGRAAGLHARVLGQPLEIVLLDDPATVGVGEPLRARLLLAGRPLADHPLRAHVRDPEGSVSTHERRTDAGGVATFDVDGRGTWLLRTVHMARCHDCAPDPNGAGEAPAAPQWQSEWSAFHFAVGDDT